MKIFMVISLLTCANFLHAQKPKVINQNTQQHSTARIDASTLNNAPIRFAAYIPESFGATGDMKLFSRYNTNNANVSFGSGGINIKKSGLYHFEGVIAISVYGHNADGLPEFTFTLQAGKDDYHIVRRKQIPLREFTNSNSYTYSEKYTMDLYITAPSTIVLKRQITKANFANSSNIMSEGWFTGYRIGD